MLEHLVCALTVVQTRMEGGAPRKRPLAHVAARVDAARVEELRQVAYRRERGRGVGEPVVGATAIDWS